MKVKKILSRVLTGILVTLLLLTLAFTISSKMSGGAPKVMGYEMMTVLSGSMEPGIHTGSVVAVKPVTLNEAQKLKLGDVVTYRLANDPNTLITHRIKETKVEDGQLVYITKGDANDSPDPKSVPAANIVGKYAGFTIPYAGYFSSFTKSKMGIIWLMIVPGSILILWQIISLYMVITRLEKNSVTRNDTSTNETTM